MKMPMLIIWSGTKVKRKAIDMAKKLLDLFCGGGGAAKGYHDAGFEVVGVDNKPQPHYPYKMIVADAIPPAYTNWYGTQFMELIS
ncbi:hypothetical protein LCGC14_2569610 [marine sediment metagenome]|uniref:DNA (cytosine-5-)-methyltransferase n=1 Tax=marine sediment metagenome TaxID=412755 RepID=A0A0F9AI27_9ZZZZ